MSKRHKTEVASASNRGVVSTATTLPPAPESVIDASKVAITSGQDLDVKESEITASVVADLFVRFSNEHGVFISSLMLEKLLYYAQAWYLAIFDKPLFHDRIEAWIQGPALPDISARFASFGHNPIDEIPAEWRVPSKVKEHIAEIMSVYAAMSAYDLERLSCSEEPWTIARKDTDPEESSSEEISHKSMREFYKSRLNGA